MLLLANCTSRALLIGLGQRFDDSSKLDDLKAGGRVVPIVAPANQNVATASVMAVLDEVAALELELDPNALPLPWRYLPLGFTVREAYLNRFN